MVLASKDGIFKAPRDASDYSADPKKSGHWWAFGSHVDGLTTKVRNMEKTLARIASKLGA